MSPTMTSERGAAGPRVGIPWRTSEEERNGSREKLDYYFRAVEKAGGQPTEVSLQQTPDQLRQQLDGLDGFVLPGSPADVNPARYRASRHLKTKTLDANRDATDEAILAHAVKAGKPVLAICYGCQILNVHFGGSLIQDISAEKPAALGHGNTDLPAGASKGDAAHPATFAADSRLATLNQGTAGQINSSHHQALDAIGKNLKVTAQAPDGIIEGVEWTGDTNWILGVQWHPERMPGDRLAERLFSDFVAAARTAREALAHKN